MKQNMAEELETIQSYIAGLNKSRVHLCEKCGCFIEAMKKATFRMNAFAKKMNKQTSSLKEILDKKVDWPDEVKSLSKDDFRKGEQLLRAEQDALR
ncbi:MAG: hypothetical protein GY847_28640 [Proteobacteria bacterium]|nr:hypothetical protein [Pseudomonadota bacterium]